MATMAVHTGRWTDHSKNDILGSRVTMTTKSATILVAFIALFDGLVGNIFWNLLSYILHQCRARDSRAHDGLFHQLQVMLRNTNEPFAFAQNVTLGGWAWRKHADKAMIRAVAFSILAIATSLIFSAAGVASSLIVSTGSVLLTGTQCGFFNPVGRTLAEKAAISIQGSAQGVALLHGAIEYAQACYRNPLVNRTNKANSRLSPNADCNFFVKPTLDWTTTIGAPCPFADPSVCSVPDSEIIQLDTGYINSDLDLGINGPASDRVDFRRVITCSPVTKAGFTDDTFVQTGLVAPFDEVVPYSYGYSWAQQLSRSNITSEEREAISSWLIANNITFAYMKSLYDSVGQPYYVDSKSIFLGQRYVEEEFYIPVPRISEDPKSPVSIFFLANHALFLGQNVTDPWFEALELSVQIQDQYVVPTYYTSTPGSLMGCLEQYQVCNPNGNNRICSNLDTTYQDAYPFVLTPNPSSIDTGKEFFAPLGMNLVQQQIATNLLDILQITSFPWLVNQGGANVLLANQATFASQAPFTPPLPPNQWQVEVENWMAISNAWIQRYILQSVTGPIEAAADPYWQLISDPATAAVINNTAAYNALQQLCSAQKIRSTAFQSFSVLGLALNFILGGLLLIAGIAVRYCVPTAQVGRTTSSKAPGNKYRHRAWIGDGNLQLQRTAYEQLGTGDWEGHDIVPLTKKGQLFQRPAIGVPQDARDRAAASASASVAGFGQSDDAISLEERPSYANLLRKDRGRVDVRVRARASESTMKEYEDVTQSPTEEGYGL